MKAIALYGHGMLVCDNITGITQSGATLLIYTSLGKPLLTLKMSSATEASRLVCIIANCITLDPHEWVKSWTVEIWEMLKRAAEAVEKVKNGTSDGRNGP